MTIGDKLHGFTVLAVRDLPELEAKLWEMEYSRNGAKLLWLDRADDNKTFAITFKTIPVDDTGVFHIIEHSVLCGSRKYPLRDPFVALIKSSLNTFLNALTFPDKTMYPVSSRNDRDFLNLMDVYLDAVLHPLAVVHPEAFWQEGWHYEKGEDGKLSCNGVVYNEMKGAYASSDRLLGMTLNEQLFPQTCYGCSSGGDPAHIPELSFEQFCASHARYYHPSNAYIILDGSVDLDAALAKMDSFLCEFERINPQADIPLQKAVSTAERTVSYEIGADEDAADKWILGQGWVCGDFGNQQENMAAAILTDVLCGSNESPLKRALLEKKLAQDVTMEFDDSIQQSEITLCIRNTTEGNKEAAFAEVRQILQNLADTGIDREQLTASLNLMEFRAREKDFGSMPKGLIYAITALNTWLYGGDPAQDLQTDAVFAALRQNLETDYFEVLLRKLLVDNPHTARVVLCPSATLGDEKIAAEAARVENATKDWNDTDFDRLEKESALLQIFRTTPDSPEVTATLPLLSLSDIPETVPVSEPQIDSCKNTVLLRHALPTGGIVYGNLYFALDDFSIAELQKLSFSAGLLGVFGTKTATAMQIMNRVKSNLGSFSVGIQTMAKRGQVKEVTPYLTVSFSVLPTLLDVALPLLQDILFRTDFSDTDSVNEYLRQNIIGMQQSTVMGGHRMASLHACAPFSAKGALDEALSGMSYLRFLQAAEKAGGNLASAYADFIARVFVRERMTVSITGPADDAWITRLIESIPSDPAARGKKQTYTVPSVTHDGVLIPAAIGFAAKAINFIPFGKHYSGDFLVASQYLTYDYLWKSIRVNGGAYGTGLSVDGNGNVRFYSYRDPQAARSLDVYNHVGDALRSLCDSDESIDGYIISTISNIEPLLTPRSESTRNDVMYLTGRNAASLLQTRSEILHTTKDSLRSIAQVFDELMADNTGVCVVAGKDILDACQGLDSVCTLEQ